LDPELAQFLLAGARVSGPKTAARFVAKTCSVPSAPTSGRATGKQPLDQAGSMRFGEQPPLSRHTDSMISESSPAARRRAVASQQLLRDGVAVVVGQHVHPVDSPARGAGSRADSA